MSKKEKTKVEETDLFENANQPLMMVDATKVLENLKISASFVSMLQNVLIYLLRDIDADQIVSTFKEIDEVVASGDSERKLTEYQSNVYTLITLVQYLRYEANKQGALRPHKALTPKDLEPALKAFANQDYDKVRNEMDTIMGRVKPITAD